MENKLLESFDELEKYELYVNGRPTNLIKMEDAKKVLENLEIKLT
jgi:hypothetical protein